jgi:hypothetical protein
MNDSERFVYHSYAAILSGHVYRPTDTSLDLQCASALPVTGGVSRARLSRCAVAGVVSFESAETHAQGVPHESAGRGRAKKAALAASMAHAGAEVRGLRIGGRVPLSAKRVRAELTAVCACDAREPSIGQMDGASFQGVAIGRYKLTVAIDRAFFRAHDTHTRICDVCVAHEGAPTPRAILAAPRPDDDPPQPHVLTTIVKQVRWNGRPYPRATIDGHVVTVPAFGRVFFGEMLVAGPTRRLTMIRCELDGEVALHGACCEVEAGGTWYR